MGKDDRSEFPKPMHGFLSLFRPVLLTTPGGGRGAPFIRFLAQQEGNLEIKVHAYRPPFTRCVNTPALARPVSSACGQIIDTINLSAAETSFGARGVGAVGFELPIVLRDREIYFIFLDFPSRLVYTSFPISPFRFASCRVERWLERVGEVGG